MEQLAEQMLPSGRFEDLHILTGPYIMEDWDPELVKVDPLPILMQQIGSDSQADFFFKRGMEERVIAVVVGEVSIQNASSWLRAAVVEILHDSFGAIRTEKDVYRRSFP